MKRIALAILAIAFVIGSVAPSFAVELQARGSWRAAGEFYDLEAQDSNKELQSETFRARERARIWFDFVANENLKAVLGLEIGDFRWGQEGGGQLGTDGTSLIEVKHAYFDFNVPNTEVNIKAGLQALYIPGALGSLVLDDDAAAVMVSAPINDMVSVAAGWIRAYDDNDGTQEVTDTKDNFDTMALLVPVNADGFNVTPYFLYSMIGKEVLNNSDGTFKGSRYPSLHEGSGGAFVANPATDDANMWHAGFNAQIDMFDPIVVMTDFVYGSLGAEIGGSDFDIKGWIFDLAVDYKMDFMTPELFFLYASGDDGDNDNEYGVMPVISPDYTFSTFGMDGSSIGAGNLIQGDSSVREHELATIPMWAVGLKLKDISFIEDLSHTFTIYYAQGTNDKAYKADSFCEEDSMIEVNFDTKYQIYDELAAYLELGYINIDWDDTSATGHADSLENAYQAALGIKYDF
jgi:hypothetical protein